MSVASMAKFVRRISFVAALLLSLSLSMPAQADQPPPPPVVNPSFGTAPTCTTSGWTTVGNVTALTEAQAGLSASSNCVARVHAQGLKQSRIAMLSQTLTIPENSTQLEFTLWAYADNPTSGYASQTITLLDASGSTIYTQSRNISSTNPINFQHYLGMFHAGEALTLKISTYTYNYEYGGSYQAILHIDNVHFTQVGKPDPNGGGSGGW